MRFRKLTSVILAILIMVSAILPCFANLDLFSLSASASSSSFAETFTSELKFLSEKQANSFIGFIYNIRTERVSDEQRTSDYIFDYLTGKLEKGSDEYNYAQFSFLITANYFAQKNATVSCDLATQATQDLTELLQKKVGNNESGSQEIVNAELGKIKSEVKKILYYAFDIDSDDMIATIDMAMSGYNTASSIPGKIQSLINGIQTAIDTCYLITYTNSTKAYNYYLTYVNNRNIGTEQGLLELIMDAYSINNISAVDGVSIFFENLGFGNSWTNEDVQKLLRTFGEFTYHSLQELNNMSNNGSQGGVATRFGTNTKPTAGSLNQVIEHSTYGYQNVANEYSYDNILANHYLSTPQKELIDGGMSRNTIGYNYVTDIGQNGLFLSAYSVWKASGYIIDPISAVEDVTNVSFVSYYEAMILKCLEAEITSQNAIDKIYNTYTKNYFAIVKAITDAKKMDTFNYITEPWNKYASELTEEETESLIKTANEVIKESSPTSYKILTQSTSFASTLLKASGSVNDFCKKISAFQTLSNYSDNTIQYFRFLAANCEEENLSTALEEMAMVIEDSFMSVTTASSFESEVAIAKSFFSKRINEWWKSGIITTVTEGKLSTGAQLVNGAFLAITVGHSIGDICFSTSKSLDKYEQMKCMVNFVNLQRRCIPMLGDAYQQGNATALEYIDAIQLLYKSYAAEADLTSAAINVLKDSYISFSSDAECQEALEGVAAEKSYFNAQYQLVTPVIGSCGDSAFWFINNRNLLIVGAGSTYDYDVTKAPWYAHRDEIDNIYVSSNITRIGNANFYGLQSQEDIVLYDVTQLGSNNFNTISSLVFGCSVSIGNGDVRNIYCKGTVSFVESVNLYGDVYAQEVRVKDYIRVYSGDHTIKGDITGLDAGQWYEKWFVIDVRQGAQLFIDGSITGLTNLNDNGSEIWNAGQLFISGNISGEFEKLEGIGTFYIYGNMSAAHSHMGNYLSKGCFVLYGSASGYECVSDMQLVLCGGSAQNVSLEGTAKTLDVYSNGTTISSIINVSGYVDFHGYNVNVTAGIGLNDGAITKEGSNYKLVLFYTGTLRCNICANEIRITDYMYVTSGNYTLTGTITGSNPDAWYSKWFVLSIYSGASLKIIGNIRGTDNLACGSDIRNSGTLTVTGDVYGKVDEMSGSGTYYSGGNIYSKEVTGSPKFIFNGNRNQQVSISNIPYCEILNSKGVTFTKYVSSTVLFNHNLNPFSLDAGGSFVDYDGDGLKDNVDPMPIYKSSFDKTLLNNLSVSLRLCVQGNGSYYWETYSVSSTNGTIEIPYEVAGFPVKIVDDIFTSSNTSKLILYPGDYNVSAFNLNGAKPVIYGYSGTSAEKLATNNGLDFVSLGTVESIKIISLPRKTDFNTKETFSVEGLTLELQTSDGKKYTTDNSFEFSGFDSSCGKKTITVYYGGQTVSYEVIVSEYSYSVLTNGTLQITKYVGDLDTVVIPSAIEGHTVSALGSSIAGLDNVASITIPSSVSTISSGAFNSAKVLASIDVELDSSSFKSQDGLLYTKDMSTLVRCPISANSEVAIPSGVNTIGNDAFYNCTKLEKVTLPEGVVSLGEAAFSNCSKLTEISLPNTLEIIQTDAFYRCSSLTSVSIPNNVKEIGEYAFGSCLALESVTIGEGVESIGNSAFRGCSALNSVTLNAIQCQTAGGTTSRSAFYGCSNLANIMFGEKVERIPNNFLYNSSKITDINLPNSVKKVGTRSFYNCSKINNLSLSANLISIEAYGFYGCQAITEVSLPDTLQNIGDFAFSNCKGLTEITIPIGTKFIKDSTFNGCSNLTNISVVTGNEFFASDDGVLLSIDKTNLVRCPEAKSGIYTVPNTVTSSGTYCFTNCKNITVVCKEGSSVHSFCVTNSIPYTFSSDSQQYSPKTVFSYKGHIYEIYDDAKSWKDAKAICEMKGGHLVTIADSTENSKVISAIALAASTDFWIGGTDEASEGTWTWINGESFNYSNWDTNQPDNANSGEHYAEIIKSSSKWNDGPNNAALGFICEYETSDIPFDFNFADNNTMVTITGYTGDENDVVVPDTIYGLPVTNISGTFAGCTFESITLGENVSTLTTSTLTGCTNLKNIYVDNDNQNFVSADGVVFDKAQTKIYKYPVGKQTEEYIIPSTVTSVGNYAFYETQVKKVVFPEELLSIGSYGFAYSQIESIEIPVNVQSIGLYAFRYCYSLTSVHFNAKDVSVSSSSLTQRYGVFPYTVEELIIGSEVTYLPRYLISGYYKDSSLKSVTIPPSVRSMSASTFYDCSGLVVSSYYNSPARSIASGTSGLSWNQLYCGDCQGVWQTTKAVTCLEDGEENFCCQVCGAILETKTIAATGHKFDAYAYDDAQHWKVCSCGETQEKESHSFSPYQIHKTSGGNWIKTRSCTCGYSESSEYTGTDVNLQYDNLFDFLSYVNNDLSFRLNAEGNTVSASYSHGDLNADNGVITITTGKEGETETYDVFTRYSLQNGESYYNIAVKPNTKYTLTFDVNTEKAAQCYVFANDEDYDIIKEDTIDVTGTFVDENGVLYYGIYRESQTVVAEFTTTDNTAFIQIRFGNSKFYDQTSTFSNIRIVESEMQTGYACGAVGKIFLANTAFGLLSVPCKDDYVFVGWYTQENASGKRITNENYSELSQSTQLFSYWKKVDIPRLTAEKNKIHIGEQVQMAYSYPYQTVTPTDVQWDVDKPYLAQVDANGLLTATNAGYVTVTATDETGRSASCRIHILPNTPVIGIFSYGGDYEQKLDWWKPYSSASLCLGYHAYNCEEVVFFRWSSNNKKVQVDQNGVVTNSGRFCRKATITVTGYNADGQVVTSSDITVAFYKFNWQEKYLFPQSVRNDCVTQQSTTEQDTKRIQSELTLSERIFSIVEYVLSVFFGNILK